MQAFFGRTPKDDESEPFGNDIRQYPGKQCTRFLLYNPNGIPYKDMDFLTQLIRRCMECHVHYCGFTEINVNTSNYTLCTKMKIAVEKFISSGLFHMNNTKIHGGAVDFQPGGVAAWFHGRLGRKFKNVEYDKRGRWISHHFQEKQKNLMVYTLYRVNNFTSKPGSATAWDQQKLVLKKDNIDNNPRKQVIAEFLDQIRKTMEKGFSVIVMSDLNEGIHDKEGTNNVFADIGLSNVMEMKFKHLPKTHKEGRRAIDHIWGTSDVLECVETCGFAPFNHISNSDHRAVFMDLNLNKLLPASEVRMQSSHMRSLKSTNPPRVKEYNKTLQVRWKAANIDKRWNRIRQSLNEQGATTQNVNDINKLDSFITDLMMNSEDKAITLSTPFHNEWSEKLHKAAKSVLDWGYKVRQSVRLFKNAKVDLDHVSECKEECAKAKERLRDIRQNSKQHRVNFQTEQAAALHNQLQIMGHQGGNYISMIQNTEKKTAQFARIQRALDRKYSKAISCVWIPGLNAYPENERNKINIYDIDRIWDRVQKHDGKDIKDWKPIENQYMIERLLLQWQQKHFKQAGETPLTDQRRLEWLQDPNIQEQILEGTFEGDEDLPFETSLFLKSMIRSIPSIIDHCVSFQEFTNFIRKAKESTSCSPSGRHYGHYKALRSGNQHILNTIFDIFATALDKGIILNRWSKTVTTLIEKKQGTPYVHKFRTIHIVEAELQFFTKVIFARRMMKTAETHGQITDDQYGGRQRRQAASVVLNKVLYYDISRQSLTTSAFMDDDAKACYDRVVPQLAEIESQKWGLSYKASNLATTIIQSQKFFVRTGFGISNESYGYNHGSPLFGVGQGLGWSGPMWLNTSDTLNRVINKRCGGMKFTSFDTSVEIEKKNDMFVDDTASGVTENCVRPGNTVVQQLQADEQLHASLLFSAGHRLASQKCSWYLVQYKRKGLNHSIIPKNGNDETVMIKEGFQYSPKKIERLEGNEAHKSMGHWICPSGASEAQMEAIRSKTDMWTKRISTSSLSKEDRKVAYSAFLLPSIRYKLTSTTLSYEECDRLMVRVKEILLNANGMNRNCDRNILFQPMQNMGLGYRHWYHVQGIEKVKLLLLHLRSQDSTGKLLRISMSYTQMEAGTSKWFFDTNFETWGKYATKTWTSHLWKYLSDCKVSLGLAHAWKYKPPRINDTFLLDLIEDSKLDEEQKKILNQIRIHLKILTLSDMIVVNKKSTILPEVMTATMSRDSSFNWPRSDSLPPAWKTIWKSFLQTNVTSYLYHRPLGAWISATHQRWSTFTNPDMDVIVVNSQQYDYTRGRFAIRTKSPKLCLYPADINRDQLLGHVTYVPQLHHQKSSKSNIHAGAWIDRNRGIEISTEDEKALKKCILSHNCIGVSDGSLYGKYPAHAWCFANKSTGEIVLKGQAPVDGDASMITSFRAEGFGILAMATIVQKLFEDPQLTNCSVTLYSDGESVIKKMKQPVAYKTKFMLESDNDVILELQQRLITQYGQVRVEYVPGHRDKHSTFEELPLTQQLNVIMDSDVRDFIENLQQRPKRSEVFPILPNAQSWLLWGGGTLSYGIEQRLLSNYYAPQWKEYSGRKFEFTNEINTMVDRTNLGHVLRNSSSRSQSVKILHAVQFTSEVRKRWGLSQESTCPLCTTSQDIPSHIYSCGHKLMVERQRKHRDTLRKYMNKRNTCPHLHKLIMQLYGMEQCTTTKDFPNYEDFPVDIQGAIHEQIDIGTHLFKLGIVSGKFGELYVQHCEWPNKGGNVWTRGLIRTFLNISRDLWSFRCSIQHEEDSETLDILYRTELWNLCQALQPEWWRFGASDRHLLQVDKKFFFKGSNRVIDMWKQQVSVAQESAYYMATKNVEDIRTFYKVSQPRTIRKKEAVVQPLVPTQVLYRQMRLSNAVIKDEFVTPRRNSTKIFGNAKRPITAPITKWLTRKGSRRKPQIQTGSGDDNNTGLQQFGISPQEDISSCPAVSIDNNTRKIKYFIN